MIYTHNKLNHIVCKSTMAIFFKDSNYLSISSGLTYNTWNESHVKIIMALELISIITFR